MASKDKRKNGSAPDDAEFEKLLDEMDELGRQADALREKVNYLIDEMRENDVALDGEAVDEDEDNNASGEAGNSASGEAVDEDNSASGEVVDEDNNAP